MDVVRWQIFMLLMLMSLIMRLINASCIIKLSVLLSAIQPSPLLEFMWILTLQNVQTTLTELVPV